MDDLKKKVLAQFKGISKETPRKGSGLGLELGLGLGSDGTFF